MFRPTAYLSFNLAEPDATSANASAIKRGFSYIAPTRVTAARHAVLNQASRHDGAHQDANQNETHAVTRTSGVDMRVCLGDHPYWLSSEDADAMWNETLMPWLATKVETLFGTVYEFNDSSRPSFVSKITYGTLTLRLQPYRVDVTLEHDSTIQDIRPPLEAARAYLNSGTVDPTRVVSFTVPSREQVIDARAHDAEPIDKTAVNDEPGVRWQRVLEANTHKVEDGWLDVRFTDGHVERVAFGKSGR